MPRDSPLVDSVRVLEIRIKKNTLAMDALMKKFHSEFGILPGQSGWTLHLHRCGKKGCTSCPHRIGWVYYTWMENADKPWFDNHIGLRTRLPGSFYTGNRKRWRNDDPKIGDPRHRPRKKAVADRFKRYEWTVRELNEERKKLMSKKKRINLMLHPGNMPKEASDHVGDAPRKRYKPGTGKSDH